MKYQSGGSILKHYKGSVVKALIDVYPSLNLSPGDFDHMIRTSPFTSPPLASVLSSPPGTSLSTNVFVDKYWHKFEHRKLFFDSIAKKRDFDPLLAANWYNVPFSAYCDEKVHLFLSSYYFQSLIDVSSRFSLFFI